MSIIFGVILIFLISPTITRPYDKPIDQAKRKENSGCWCGNLPDRRYCGDELIKEAVNLDNPNCISKAAYSCPAPGGVREASQINICVSKCRVTSFERPRVITCQKSKIYAFV